MFETQLSDIWKETLQLLERDLSKPTFDTWLKATELVAYYGETIIIKTPNEFAKNNLENNYLDLIKSHLESLLNHAVKLKFVTAAEKEITIKNLYIENGYDQSDLFQEDDDNHAKDMAKMQQEQDEEDYFLGNHGLNPKYTFDTFVIGNSNRFTHAACLAVAESIAKSLSKKKIYNPLFIYGGAGLGKTHLMQAIGHHILSHNANARIKYVSSEKFTNELIDGIKDNTTARFRNKYRSVDVLLIDDIQFLAKKESTQEEFFHTFNALYEANKQIIISSDRQPKEIPTLEERLRTRFEWGLITDVQAPDLETRIAILRKKAQIDNLEIGDDVMLYIAENIQSNIRELEGVLMRLAAFSDLSNREINLELAQECLQNIIPSNAPIIITGELIQQKVAEMYSLKVDDLKAKKRTRNVVYPRQIAMYLCREMTDMSLPKIGEIFGGRDHTTVIHAYDKIALELKKDVGLQNILTRIKNSLIN